MELIWWTGKLISMVYFASIKFIYIVRMEYNILKMHLKTSCWYHNLKYRITLRTVNSTCYVILHTCKIHSKVAIFAWIISETRFDVVMLIEIYLAIQMLFQYSLYTNQIACRIILACFINLGNKLLILEDHPKVFNF